MAAYLRQSGGDPIGSSAPNHLPYGVQYSSAGHTAGGMWTLGGSSWYGMGDRGAA